MRPHAGTRMLGHTCTCARTSTQPHTYMCFLTSAALEAPRRKYTGRRGIHRKATHKQTDKHTPSHTTKCTHAQMHAHTNPPTQHCMHTHIHTYAHTHIHTHTPTHPHPNTCVQPTQTHTHTAHALANTHTHIPRMRVCTGPSPGSTQALAHARNSLGYQSASTDPAGHTTRNSEVPPLILGYQSSTDLAGHTTRNSEVPSVRAKKTIKKWYVQEIPKFHGWVKLWHQWCATLPKTTTTTTTTEAATTTTMTPTTAQTGVPNLLLLKAQHLRLHVFLLHSSAQAVISKLIAN
jgi:hypothetical protein